MELRPTIPSRLAPLLRSTFWLYFLCFASRLLYVAYSRNTLVGLRTEYEIMADNFLHTGRMVFSFFTEIPRPSAFMPPGLIFILIGLKNIFAGSAFLWLALLQISLAVVVLYYLRKIAQHIFGPMAAFLVSILYLLDINLFIPVAWANETIYTFVFTTIYVYYIIDLAERPSFRSAALAGLFMGLALLFRSTVIVHLVVAFPWLGLQFLRRHSDLRAWRNLAVVGFFLLLPLAPWTVRNYRIFKKIIPVSQNFGANLWMGWNPQAAGSQYASDGGEIPLDPDLKDQIEAAPSEAAEDAILTRYAVRCALENPRRWIKQRFLSLAFFWHQHNFWMSNKPFPGIAWWLVGFFDLIFLACFFVSAALYLKKDGAPRFLLLLLFFHSFLYTLIHADIGSRFRYQIEPIMLLFIAAAINRLRNLRLRQDPATPSFFQPR